jgi:hypothetical protein
LIKNVNTIVIDRLVYILDYTFEAIVYRI